MLLVMPAAQYAAGLLTCAVVHQFVRPANLTSHHRTRSARSLTRVSQPSGLYERPAARGRHPTW